VGSRRLRRCGVVGALAAVLAIASAPAASAASSDELVVGRGGPVDPVTGDRAMVVVDPVDGRLATVVPSARDAGSWSPDGDRLGVTLPWTGLAGIPALVNSDGSCLTAFASGDEYATAPRFSPDGRALVLGIGRLAARFIPTLAITISGTDGRGHRPLPSASGYQPRWSPDGAQVLYRGGENDPSSAFVVPANASSGPTRLTNDFAVFSWSHDGTRVVGNAYTAGPHGEQLAVLRIGDPAPSLILPLGGGSADAPTWSHDDSRIYFGGGNIGPASVDGLWSVKADGSDLRQHTSGASFIPSDTTVARPGRGLRYRTITSDATISDFGRHCDGSGQRRAIATLGRVVGAAESHDRPGTWLVASNGVVSAAGSAPRLGDLASTPLRAPVVGIASTPRLGYRLAAADGGVFAFGDAKFFGSLGALHLNAPVVGIAATPTGRGYWLVASDGGVFAFGDAKFFGSLGALHLNAPIVGMAAAPGGTGYWLVARDGGVFAFGRARFRGSLGTTQLAAPVVAMSATTTGNGYWLAAQDGGVFAFGDAPYRGSNRSGGVVAFTLSG
jgi:WD40 repeat protein